MGKLNGLDLFSGIGGLSLALSPWTRTIAYCENDRYAQAVLLSRMQKRELEIAPIWDDVRTIRGEMLPPIDIIYGGFPCQDISVAGNGVGMGGERSGLFYEIVRLSKEIKPAFVFLENVSAIRTRGLDRVIWELSELGYDCRWDVISAAEVRAPHIRDRWFLLAHAVRERGRIQQRGWSGTERKNPADSLYDGKKKPLANTNGSGPQVIQRQSTEQTRLGVTSRDDWWSIEPDVGRVANGVPLRVDRLRGLGNAVVPLQAREAFMRLSGADLLEETYLK